jgi:hypothetical protein
MKQSQSLSVHIAAAVVWVGLCLQYVDTEDEVGGTCSMHRETRTECKTSAREPEGKKLLRIER